MIAIHSGAWKDGGKSAKQWRASLSEYACHRIGDKGVDQVTTADVMAVVLPIWTSKHETAQRVRWRIGAIMKWAVEDLATLGRVHLRHGQPGISVHLPGDRLVPVASTRRGPANTDDRT